MSNHDQELITDLISGRLPPRERQAALARLAQDPTLRSEYEAQLAVSSLLADAPALVMTADERLALRASLVQQLHLDGAPAAAAAAVPPRWQRWWAPVAGLAVAAAVIVGAVVILPGVDSDDSIDMASADVTTTIAASQSDGGESEEPDVLAFSDEAEETTEALETPTTATAAVESTTTLAPATEDLASAAGDTSPRSLPHVPNLDLEALALEYVAGPQELDDALAKSASEEGRLDTAAAFECFEASDSTPTEGATVEVVASGTLDGTEVAVLVVTPRGAEPYLVALDMNSCLVVSSVRP